MEAQVINSAHKIKMETLIDCIVDKNYNGLILTGKPTEEQLLIAFQGVYGEYCEILENPIYEFIAEAFQTMAYNNWKLVGVRASIAILRYRAHEYSYEVLRQFGYNYDYEKMTPEQLSKTVDIIESKIKSVVIENTRIKQELDARIKNSTDSQPGRLSFIDSAVAMSKFYAHHIDLSVITAAEYARKYKYMSDSVEKLKKKT